MDKKKFHGVGTWRRPWASCGYEDIASLLKLAIRKVLQIFVSSKVIMFKLLLNIFNLSLGKKDSNEMKWRRIK
jgi:hypothetical protein